MSGPQEGQKRALDLLELELQTVINHHVGLGLRKQANKCGFEGTVTENCLVTLSLGFFRQRSHICTCSMLAVQAQCCGALV